MDSAGERSNSVPPPGAGPLYGGYDGAPPSPQPPPSTGGAGRAVGFVGVAAVLAVAALLALGLRDGSSGGTPFSPIAAAAERTADAGGGRFAGTGTATGAGLEMTMRFDGVYQRRGRPQPAADGGFFGSGAPGRDDESAGRGARRSDDVHELARVLGRVAGRQKLDQDRHVRIRRRDSGGSGDDELDGRPSRPRAARAGWRRPDRRSRVHPRLEDDPLRGDDRPGGAGGAASRSGQRPGGRSHRESGRSCPRSTSGSTTAAWFAGRRW